MPKAQKSKTDRPPTQRELKARQAKKTTFISLYNRSRHSVSIQLKAPPGVDFYIGEQTCPVLPGKVGKFPVDRLYKEQITNHQKAGRIKIISGSLDA